MRYFEHERIFLYDMWNSYMDVSIRNIYPRQTLWNPWDIIDAIREQLRTSLSENEL